MKTLDEIKDEVAREKFLVSWDYLETEDRGIVIDSVAGRYAEERLAESKETISSLKGRIAELESEIVVLKALKRENN